jgi:hypothetical protein
VDDVSAWKKWENVNEISNLLCFVGLRLDWQGSIPGKGRRLFRIDSVQTSYGAFYPIDTRSSFGGKAGV